MRWKPAILLFLLLLLSLGGAILFHLLRNDPRPTFAEADAFMRNEAATGDWQYLSHSSHPSRQHPRVGWWDYLRIPRSDTIQEDHYAFLHFAGEEAAYAVVERRNGIVNDVYVSPVTVLTPSGETPAASQMEALEKSIYRRLPDFVGNQGAYLYN